MHNNRDGHVSLGEYESLRELPDAQRYRIAIEMLLSLGLRAEAEYVQEQLLHAELIRRVERLRSGEDVGIPAEEVIARLQTRYGVQKTT